MHDSYSLKNDKKVLLLFMLGWFIINAMQAAFLGVDGDEAYYWVLSRNIDWGYFDHPPVVALLIRLGESFAHGFLFTRLGTIIVTTLTIGIIYKALPDNIKNIKYYLWLFAATLLFNVYSFITTPDAPLLFFSALFFLAYKKYLAKDSLPNALWMALAVTGMFYSKYHGLLPVIFVVLSNIKLLTRKSFWLMVLLVVILFLPHLYWQYTHDWATVRFHLLERGIKIYKLKYTTNYLLGQILVWGPVISILFFINLYKIKITDKYLKAHLYNFTGVLILFLFSSFKNNVQPHWTLVAGSSYIVLFMQLLHNRSSNFRKNFIRLSYVNVIIIIAARLLFLIPNSPFTKIKNYKPLFHAQAWADSIYGKAAGSPVIFSNSYIMPSLYSYYHPDAKTFGYNTKKYRKNQYSINNQDRILDGKKIDWFKETDSCEHEHSIRSSYKNGCLIGIDSFSAISNLKITALNLPTHLKAARTYSIKIKIENTGAYTIINRNNLQIEYSYSPLSYKVYDGKEKYIFLTKIIPPGYTTMAYIQITAPAIAGKNRILFSFKNGILEGNFASTYYSVTVDD